MWPSLLRPPERFIALVRLFSGTSCVISAKSDTVMSRRAADVGLKVLTPILARASLEQLDLVALFQSDERLLEVRALAHRHADALDLAAHDQRADVFHGHLELIGDRARHV